MKNIVTKIVLILALVALFIWAVSPPEEKIRLGKDLRGGVSLIYRVNVPEDAQRTQVINRVIDVLKDRVNPQGVLDITMRRQGLNRIEVVMPLPSEEVQQLRAEFDEALEELIDGAKISRVRLVEALRADNAVDVFGSTGAIGEQVSQLQTAYNNMQAARDQLQQAQADEVSEQELGRLQQQVADAEITYEDLLDGTLELGLEEDRLRRALRLSTDPQLKRDPSTGDVLKDEEGNNIEIASPREVELTDIKQKFPHLAEQIEEVVAAWDEYDAERTSLDDPEDLVRLLRGAGVLEFHIAVQPSKAEGVNIDDMRSQLAERGPTNTDSPVAAWYPINDPKQWYDTPAQQVSMQNNPVQYFQARDLAAARYQGQIYLLLWTTPKKSMTHSESSRWSMTGAQPTVDQLGRNAVGFDLNQAGGRMMNSLTGPHVGEPMAIVLDGQIYSAPTLQSTISGSGQITGTFSDQEINYLIRVLEAGALEARLSRDPISTSIIGPSLGGDNLMRGLTSCVIAGIAVCIFMIAYYFFAGFVASIALMINGLFIFGGMALIDGTFTLPGLAGIVLTIGMAVDANVLIYERVREELMNNHEDLRTAIRLGYQKALSTIIDGNITNLIICFVLYQTATTEVKGFAMTLAIGILATLFTALFVTRVFYTLYTEFFRMRTMPMLATIAPSVHRALEPAIDWMAKRYVFRTIGVVAIGSCIVLIAMRGAEMLDTEFRGGVAATMQTRLAEPNETAGPDDRLLLSRPEVADAIHSIGENNPNDAVLSQLANADVLTQGETTEDFKATQFQVKVAMPGDVDDEQTITDQIVDAIAAKFEDQLDVTTPLNFIGQNDQVHTAYTFPIESEVLGENINQPRYDQRVEQYLGGVAVVVEGISPPSTTGEIEDRLDRMRNQRDFSEVVGRDVEVIGLEQAAEGEQQYASVAILVNDEDLSFFNVDFSVWDTEVAQREWNLITAALQQRSSLKQVTSFSSVVAQTQTAQAVVAVILSLLGILVYIWIRFGSLWYSLAAIVALVHDVIIALGLLAVTQIIGKTVFASVLLIEQFHIDLGVVAALLTIIGYSLNDTIVLLDRIRENRGKLPLATGETINLSINQCISRTLLTSVTTLIAVAIMYVVGGEGIRPFTFTLLIGILVGTYSSVAIAAPFVYSRGAPVRREPAPEDSPGIGATATPR